jgi:polar amino acid transport system substrate-binding protein
MKKSLFFGIVVCMLLFMSAPAIAQEKITDVTLSSEEWKNATNADGTGLYWDIFKAVFEPAGIKVKHTIRSYAGSVELVRQQKVDAVVAAYIDEVKGAVYPKAHFGVDVVQALYKKSRFPDWKAEETLKGKKVGWIKGYAFDEYIKTPFNKAEFDERKAALRVLDKDKIDFFLDAQPDLAEALKEGTIDVSQYAVQTVKRLNLYLAFAGNERGKKLKQVFDERFQKLLESGELKKLYEKWKDGNFAYPY